MPRPQAKEDRRQQILDGLFAAMAEAGTAHTSVTEIAKAAGIARGALHYYFDSKDAIRLALMQGLGARYVSGLNQHIDSAPQRYPQAPMPVVRSLVRYHFGGDEDEAARLIGVWIDFWGQAPHDEALSQVVFEVQEGARRACARALSLTTAQAHALSADQVNYQAAAVLALIEGGLLQWRVAKTVGSNFDRRKLAQTIEDQIVVLVTHRPQEALQ